MRLPIVELHGVKINPLTREQFLTEFTELAESGAPGKYIVTPYSEYIVNAQSDEQFKAALNGADLSIADGIYILWATTFMSRPVKSRGMIGKLQVLGQYIGTGASIIFNKTSLTKIVPERIPGSQVAYDLAKICAERNYKLAILGGFDFGSGNTGILAAKKLQELYPSLEIVEIYPGERKEEEGQVVIDILKSSGADVLFCCYTPKREEIWLHDNLKHTGIKVGIGLGGTLDYISGVKKAPPAWVSKLGLEWLFRPFFADGYSLKAMWKRMKRGWIPAMVNSSLFSLREKLRTV
ncbi:MAG: WecB/TagA/CpsF family glycosyltransferase [Candidatus Dojkabacteria bacterium]|nr:MAG: WecB/TagA/CpsF family glycosyltransferase [Candidatus Dojkabacteria bacterium]